MKTAISLQDDLFKRVNAFAKKYHLSRSEVFVKAAEDLLEKKAALDMFNTLNEVHSKPETPEDVEFRKRLLKYSVTHVLSKEKY